MPPSSTDAARLAPFVRCRTERPSGRVQDEWRWWAKRRHFVQKRLKEKAGITFAQDASAEVDSMPASAQSSGYVDFVLSPEQISSALIDIGARFARRV